MGVRLTKEEVEKKNLDSPFASTTDFSHFEFINTRTKAKYYCTIHNNLYEMTPSNYWQGHGCTRCGKVRGNEKHKKKYNVAIRKSMATIISEFILVHGNKYDYSGVNYTKNNIKVSIICHAKDHGIFWQTPNKHLLGRGCPRCANETRNDNVRRTLDDFKLEANRKHKNFFDYSESIYLGALAMIDIICPKHGKFSQKANDHLNGHGCKYCANEENRINLVKTEEDIIDKALEVHGKFYKYPNLGYTGIYNKINIVCPIHGEFKQIANVHLRGSACPKCKKSKGEKHISKILEKNNIRYKEQYKFQDCKFKLPLPFDFYLIDYRICIEYQGQQHYVIKEAWGGQASFDYLRNNDLIKKEYCNQNRIKLIEIPYTIKNEEIERFILNSMK